MSTIPAAPPMIRLIASGPGPAEAVPAAALDRGRRAGRLLLCAVEPEAAALFAGLGVAVETGPESGPPGPPEGDLAVVAPDPLAHRLALAWPTVVTHPGRAALRDRAIGAEVAALARTGAHLRIECPWDRRQTAATIVPHTVEEAFEVAEAVAEGRGLADELGDLLFQAVFLAHLMEERGEADLAGIARGQHDKLVSRHPHVYGDAAAASAAAVVDLWERRKREDRADQGIFHELPPGLPALAYATKTQKRAAAVGFTFADPEAARAQLERELEELAADPGQDELGDVLFAAVAVARSLRVDPELALRGTAQRFRRRVEEAARLAERAGHRFEDASAQEQLRWYRRAREALAQEPSP